LKVPKRDLITATLVLLQNGHSRSPKPSLNISTAHDSYEAWREGDHDDLVLSVALSCWAGERFLRKPKLAKVYRF